MWVRVRVIYFRFFIAFRFMTLRKQICAHVSKPLSKLLGENKQQKRLIDRAKPDDVHLTVQQFLFITILIYTEAF